MLRVLFFFSLSLSHFFFSHSILGIAKRNETKRNEKEQKEEERKKYQQTARGWTTTTGIYTCPSDGGHRLGSTDFDSQKITLTKIS